MKKNKINTLYIADLLENRKTSLYNFFNTKLKDELSKIKKIIKENKNIFYLYPEEYFFKFPNTKFNTKLKNENINISLFIPAEIYNTEKKIIIKTDIFICNFPLLLNNNVYFINGISKIIHQQLIFDPGFLLNKKENKSQAYIYDENQNTQLVIEKTNNITKYKLNPIKNSLLIENFLLNKKPNKNITKKDYNLLNLSFLAYKTKISKSVRYKINKRLNICLPLNLLHLTPIDISHITKKVNSLQLKIEEITNLDDLETKTIKDLDFYYLNIIKKHIEQISFNLEDKKTKSINIATLLKSFKTDSISSDIDEFFSNSDVSLVTDETNILSELAQHNKILNLKKKEGNKNISINIRNIHPSIFGRLCVLETPEGESAGLINNLTLLSSINCFGLIETPLYTIKNNKKISNESIHFADVSNEKLYKLSYNLNKIKNYSTLIKKNIKKNNNLYEEKNTKINKSFFSYLQVFSMSCSNIPFLEHNDGNRILMGASMQKQAVPLLYTENAIVCSGLEDILAFSSNTIKALSDGVVNYVDNIKIIVENKNKNKLIYFLDILKSTFNETVIQQKSDCWCGEKIFFGQILTKGYSIKNAEVSLGTNLTIAYMNWDGLNFEDAIIISDRLIKTDKLTSLHIKTIILEIESNEQICFLNKQLLQQQYLINNLNHFGLVKKGLYIKEGDILLIKEKQNDIIKENKSYIFVESDLNGYVLNIEFIDNDIIKEEEHCTLLNKKQIKIDILQKRKIKIGDKLSGRFGNKGVISRIIPEADMPFLQDGTSVDVLLNPLGIPSRMNIGQIFETLLGFVGSSLNKRYKILSFDETFGQDATRILINQKIKESKIRINKNYSSINNLDKTLIIDGRTGEFMDNPVLVGRSYILKLYHLSEDKITSRLTGPTNLITNQPVKGKKSKGGQRLGEMEVWALEAYGASFTLNEMLNMKSDEIFKSNNLFELLNNDLIFDFINYSKSLFIFDLDLKALGFNLKLNIPDFNSDIIKQTNVVDTYKKTDLLKDSNLLFNNLYDTKKF